MALSYIHSGNRYSEFKTYDAVLEQATKRANKGENVVIYQSVVSVGKPNAPIEISPCLFDPTVNLPPPKEVPKQPEAQPCNCCDVDCNF